MNSSTSFSRKRAAIGIFSILLILTSIAIIVLSKDHVNDLRSRADLSDDVSELSKDLLSNKSDNTGKIIASSKRKDKMKALAKNDPEKFLLIVIPKDIKNTLPVNAQKNIEEKVELNGVISEEIVEEHNPKRKNKNNSKVPTLIFQTVDSEGNSTGTYELYIREGLEPDFDGRAKIEGYLIDNVLVPIKIGKENLQTRNINFLPGQDVLGINTSGVNKLAVIMVNFKNDDSDVTDNFTKQQLETIYFSAPNSVANYINDATMGNVTIQGDINDVYGWIDLPGYTRRDVCDIYEETEAAKGFKKAINDLVKPIATSRGKTFADYNIRAYVFPSIDDQETVGPYCNWNAITYGIPGDNIVQPIHFLNGDYDGLNSFDHGPLDGASAIKFYSGILAHEVGHSLGLSHAHAFLCGSKQISSFGSCTLYRYGDRFDLIGGAWDYHSHTNVKNKILLGWLPSTNKKTITTSGTYTLYSGSKNRSNQVQTLIIDRPTDGGNYYLDYKSKNNGDGGGPTSLYEGALLRISDLNPPAMTNEGGGISDEWRTKQTYLIDVDKTDSSGRGGLLNTTFKDNMTFSDTRNDVTIKQLSHDTESVTLSVIIGPPPCEKLDPSLIIAEPALSGSMGEKVRYSITIKNNNSSTCPDATFDLNSVPPEDWTAIFGRTSVTLASGAQTTVVLDVTSPALNATADQNPYLTKITVENSANSTFSKTKQVSYSIEAANPVTQTPTPSKSPTPTKTPTPSPSPMPILTSAPVTNIPTPIPGTTILHFPSVKLHGIGRGGDNSNPNAPGNPNPLTAVRVITVELFDFSGSLVGTSQGNVSYNPSTGDFSGDVTIPSILPTSPYTIKVKIDKYLKRQLTGIPTITKNALNQAPNVSLTIGDSNLDNKLNSLDFSIITDCYSDLLPAKNCSDASKKTRADLSDDGKINQDDYNLFLRELSTKQGD